MTGLPPTLGAALRASAARDPGREALVGEGERITYAELDARVDAFAAALIRLGIGRGDNVALWMTNGPTWVVVYLACARIGAVLVTVNTRFKREEAEYVLRRSDAKLLVAMDTYWGIDFAAMIRAMVPSLDRAEPGRLGDPNLPALRAVVLWTSDPLPGCLTIGDLTRPAPDVAALAEREAAVRTEDPVVIVFTSGTTGHPKGAVHGHVMLRNAAAMARLLRMGPRDVVLGHMPFYHIAGAFTAILPTLLVGATLVTLPHWKPDEALDTIVRERVSVFGGIPTHFIDCLDAIRARPRDTSCLRTAWIGGAPVTPDVAAAARSELRLDSLQAIYGMTETTACTNASGFDDPLAIVCANKGRTIGDFEVAVRDPETGALRPTGEAGEIMVRGHVVMHGYYGDPAATAAVTTADGWFRTGDLGALDADGYLAITGRVKDMFIVGGSNAYPAEIERMLQAHPAIKQAVVVGAPDRRLGEVGHAFVQLDDGATLTAEAIIAYCRGAMADYKVPRRVALVDEFPRTPTGKIQRFVLSARAREAAGG